MKMKPIAAVILSAVAVTACVTRPPIALSDKQADRHSVPVKIISVDNLSTDGEPAPASEKDWVQLSKGFSPSVGDVFVSKLKNSIVAAGSEGRADVSVLRVGLFIEIKVAEQIPFVGLLAMGADKGYKCDADVNIKTETKSSRTTFSHEVTREPFNAQAQFVEFAESCQSDLIKQIAKAITESK